jgi:hypothetical protein
MTTRTAHRWVESGSETEEERRASLFSPSKLDRPIHVAVISNPASGNNRRGNRLASMLDELRLSGIAHAEADCLDGLIASTQRLLADGVELMVVNGGDGTVQAVLTGIFRAPHSADVPVVAVLPGGTTNTTARNVGFGARADLALHELVEAAAGGRLPGKIHRHHVLKVERSSASEPLYAMFFGAGAVYHGIRFAKDHVESRGLRGELGAGITLAVFLGRIITGQGGKLFPPLHARAVIDGGEVLSDELLGILTSTMERQFLGIRPYWGREPGPIHYSALSYSARSPVRAALSVMRGKPNRFVRLELGYRSHNASCIELQIDSGFTLDGELFAGGEGTSLRLTAEQSALFLRRAPE